MKLPEHNGFIARDLAIIRCACGRGRGDDVSADEYPAPPRVVGRGAVFIEHRLKTPQVSESAYIAPTAVLAGDVTIGPHSRVLFGAVITAEGGPVEIAANCVIMEHAVIRGVPGQETRVGDNVLVGPHAHLTGCVIEGDSRIATGAVVFNGARIEAGGRWSSMRWSTSTPSSRPARRYPWAGSLAASPPNLCHQETGAHPRHHGTAGLLGHSLWRGHQRHGLTDARHRPPLFPGTSPAP